MKKIIIIICIVVGILSSISLLSTIKVSKLEGQIFCYYRYGTQRLWMAMATIGFCLIHKEENKNGDEESKFDISV